MTQNNDSHHGESKVSVGMASQRTTNTTRLGSITSRILYMMRPFPQMNGIPVKSMDITCLFCQQVGSQHGPQTG